MTEEHNVPEAPERQETDAEKIERLEKREQELTDQVQAQSNRIQSLSNKIGERNEAFKLLAEALEPYLSTDPELCESDVEEIARNEIENVFSDKFSDHIADVTVDIEINDATATLSY